MTKPRHIGDRYCSSECGRGRGRGCTWQMYQEALKNAQALAERLGPKWKPDVWENLGWHYRALSSDGTIKVHQDRPTEKYFNAYFGEVNFPGGNWVESGRTPRAAVVKVIARALQKRNEIQALIDSVKHGANFETIDVKRALKRLEVAT